MKRFFPICLMAVWAMTVSTYAQTKSWEGIHQVPLSEVEEQFNLPPIEFASHVIWGWEGKMDKKTIQKDLDSIKSKGFRRALFQCPPFTAHFDKVGVVKEWNANEGSISEIPFKVVNGKTELTFKLAPWESKIITITPSDEIK